jgi:hypothetical protein
VGNRPGVLVVALSPAGVVDGRDQVVDPVVRWYGRELPGAILREEVAPRVALPRLGDGMANPPA